MGLLHEACLRGRHDSSSGPATVRIKFCISPFTPDIPLLFWGLPESRVNLPGAIPLRQDTSTKAINTPQPPPECVEQ